jgi:outer membrane protein
MKKGYFIFIIPMFQFLTSGQLYAQEKWSLERCINYALEHNIQIKQQKLSTQIADGTLLQSKAALLPSINGTVSQNYSFGRSIDYFTNEFSTDNIRSNNFSIYASMPLFEGFQRINTIEKNRFNLLASLSDLEKLKNDISLNIAAAYLQILFNEEMLEIARNQLTITRQQADRTKQLVDAGSLAQGNLLEVLAQAANEELQMVNSQSQLDISYLILIQMLDLDSTLDFHIEHPVLSEISDNEKIRTVTSVYQEALMFLPQIKSSEYKLKSSEKELAIARAGYLPKLNLTASYYTGYSDARKKTVPYPLGYPVIGYLNSQEPVYSAIPMFDYVSEDYPFKEQLRDNAYKSLGLNLNIPIFNNLQVRNSVNTAKIGVLNAQYQLETTKKNLFKEIQQAEADATAALKKYYATQKSLTAFEESFRYTKQKFDVGMVTSVDFNTAKNSLTKAQSELLQAKYEYIFKLNVLEFYRGNPVKL